MFKRKEKPFNYSDAITDIRREIMNKNIQLSDPEYYGINKRTLLAYNLADLNKLLRQTTYNTKKLLIEKGFTLSIEDRVEKTVLLNTEISELADSVKKGLGVDSEGSEIADIVIRAANFLCMEETHNSYEKLSNVLYRTVDSTDTVIVGTSVDGFNSDSRKSKYMLIEEMMICWMDIKKSSEMLEICFTENLGSDKFNTSFTLMWNKIIELMAYCSAYVTLYLPKNLHFYIEHKMSENFKRPYKYGTFEEIK